MSQRHADVPGIRWQLMDVCNMDDVPAGSIDVAFDKGTLDAMIHGSPWSPPQDVVEHTAAYIQEVRVRVELCCKTARYFQLQHQRPRRSLIEGSTGISRAQG